MPESIEPFVYCGVSGFQGSLPGNEFGHLFPLVGLATQKEIDIVALVAGRFDQRGNAGVHAAKLRGVRILLGRELTDYGFELVEAFVRGHFGSVCPKMFIFARLCCRAGAGRYNISSGLLRVLILSAVTWV